VEVSIMKNVHYAKYNYIWNKAKAVKKIAFPDFFDRLTKF
jgi:hypothetical protein